MSTATNTADITTTDTTTGNGVPSPRPITAGALRQLLHDEPHTRVLDVRTDAEFHSVHIPGSYNVPLDELAEHVHAVAQLDAPVVLVCLSGNRASTAQQKLNRAGKTNLRVLDGGIGAWQEAGGDVVHGRQSWSLERQVRGVAGGLVLASMITGLAFPRARLLAAGIGAGLAFSAVSDTCAMGMMLAKLPYNRGPECAIDDVLAQMRS